MPTFGKARLLRSDVNCLHKVQFRLCGVGDPSHFLRAAYFRKFVRRLTPKSILDAGSGGGDYSFWMAEYWPHAVIDSVDIREDLIIRNKQIQDDARIPNIRFERLDITQLATKSTYDLIVCIDALEHIAEQDRVLRNFHSALTPGGRLYLHIPLVRPRNEPFKRHLAEFHKWTEEEHIGKERTGDEVCQMLKDCEFSVEQRQFTFHYHFGELACSLFSMFFEDTARNRLAQGLLLPLTRMLCYGDLVKAKTDGFALAVLAQKAARTSTERKLSLGSNL